MKTLFIEIPTNKIELLKQTLEGENGILIEGLVEMNPRNSEVAITYEWDEDEDYILEIEERLNTLIS